MNIQKASYESIYREVRENILNDTLSEGSLLPTELEMAAQYSVSRPTVAKVYNRLQTEGLIRKIRGRGSMVIYRRGPERQVPTFGLLLPGAGESEIFSIINDQFLRRSKEGCFHCLWDGAMASNAQIRRAQIESCCESYLAAGVDGIFLSPLERVGDAAEINNRLCERIDRAGVPLVLIDRDIVFPPQRSRFDLVCLDNFTAGCAMAELLLEAGCEVIHYFYRPDSAPSVCLRESGIRDTVLKHGLRFGPAHIHCGDPADADTVRGMEIRPGRTGIICANDSTAAILMSTLDTLGIRISADVLVCGYDDMKYSDHLKHALTSYRQPCEQIADRSIETMMARMRNRESLPVTVHLTGEIVRRESSNFFPPADH